MPVSSEIAVPSGNLGDWPLQELAPVPFGDGVFNRSRDAASLYKLAPSFVRKPWGVTGGLPGPQDCQPLGEIVFTEDDPALIVKWLQTSEPLSVQVHPTGVGGGPRKSEWWYITDAQPGAYLYLGVNQQVGAAELERRARDGSILHILQRIEPKAGESYLVPAGTIHALGPGLTVLEVQEPCDITYRLYDYGRDRPLHIAESLEAAIRERRPVVSEPAAATPFRIKLLALAAGEAYTLQADDAYLSVLSGSGTFDGRTFAATECWRSRGETHIAADAPTRLLLAEAVDTNTLTCGDLFHA